MGYPFYENPLDDYLVKLFDLQIDEFNASCIRVDKTATPEAREAAGSKVFALAADIRALKLQYSLAERTFDQYKSAVELAVERFELENPEPPRLDFRACKHGRTQVVRKKFRDGTLHVVSQCLECGSQSGAMQKNAYDLRFLPDFDDGLYRRLNSERAVWEEARRAVLMVEMRRGNDVPDFDEATFDASFRQVDPAPCLEGCEHEDTEARLRKYPKGGDAIVLQCVRCGHHTGASSKSKYPAWASLAPFDEALAKKSKEEFSAWCRRKGDARRREHQNYLTLVGQQIQRGELSSKDNSRFGTYYDSPEWQRTRARILQRDDHQCQACKQAAECVHHIVYDRLGVENDLDLISLCHSCHNFIHQEQRKLHNIFRMTPREIQAMHDEDDEDGDGDQEG